MADFLSALSNPSIPFLRYALLAGLASGVAFGVTGTWVTIRKISYLAGAISHSVLGGIGAALYLREAAGWEWLSPLTGAFAAALIAALIIGMVRLYAGEREDTVIGAIWAVGMATGLLFIARTPGYVSPMSYLFGNILIVSRRDILMILILDAAVVTLSVLFHRQLLAAAFDEDFAETRNVNVQGSYYLLLVLTAMTVVLMTTIVGIVMVIALLTLPAAMGGMFFRRIGLIMAAATVLTMAFTASGLALSYGTDLPTGSVIIALAGGTYLAAAVLRPAVRRLRKRIRDGESPQA